MLGFAESAGLSKSKGGSIEMVDAAILWLKDHSSWLLFWQIIGAIVEILLLVGFRRLRRRGNFKMRRQI